MRHRLCALLVLLTCGCSILDPSDRDELRGRIATLPPAEMSLMKKMVMNVKAMRWLEHKDENDQMGKLQCRYQAGGQWSQWSDQEPTYTVADMLECLIHRPFAVTYIMCKDEWASLERQLRKTDLENSRPIPGGASIDCRFVWDFRYEPEKVPPELIDPDEIGADDIIDAMISLPGPPPGWAVPPQIVPLLCPLGAGPGWGCPPSPTDPTGGEPTNPTGGQPGDY
ncbi:hypothetical protein WME90_35735 [Sorangium sp. So ce375]|uniref:hypothetical protein n=1 Tax=Sorangium sp. So ce375 TaxID=3133306 RepID=UPI003F5BFAAF